MKNHEGVSAVVGATDEVDRGVESWGHVARRSLIRCGRTSAGRQVF